MLGGNGVVVQRQGAARAARHRVKVVFRGPDGGVRRATTKRNGTFAAALGRRTASATTRSAPTASTTAQLRRGSASVPRRLTAYRQAGASYYGPGLYGNGVACGGTLKPGTLGVANKTLPCGTKVKLRYHGRSVTVPVIDRGPYVAGRDYDLTEATKERLGFPGRRRRCSPTASRAQPARPSWSCRLGRRPPRRPSSLSKQATRTPSRRTGPLRVVGAQQVEGDGADHGRVVGRLPRPCASG